jgi:hypothetical protein
MKPGSFLGFFLKKRTGTEDFPPHPRKTLKCRFDIFRKIMRDIRFVAIHRGGILTKDQHHQLMRWARACSEHVLPRAGPDPDPRILHALQVARDWENEQATVGDARNASVGAIAAANASPDPVQAAIARSAGHAVATAHMADHAPGAADYALKAVRLSGMDVFEERQWQDERLSPEISGLILSVRKTGD